MKTRTALVGGGASGIGYATAAALLDHGHRVILVGRREEALVEASITLDAPAGLVEHLVCDLSDPVASSAAVEVVEQRHGGVDIAIINAGGPPPGGVLTVEDEQWREAFSLLLLGPLAMARAALPGMSQRGFGRVVFVTSSAVRQPQPELATSTVLRAAVTSASKLLSLEFAAHGVTVNCVAPGATMTQRRRQILRSRAAAGGIDEHTATARDNAAIPAARPADPSEVGAAVAFFASSDASYVNGTVLTVDGGRTETI